MKGKLSWCSLGLVYACVVWCCRYSIITVGEKGTDESCPKLNRSSRGGGGGG